MKKLKYFSGVIKVGTLFANMENKKTIRNSKKKDILGNHSPNIQN